MPMTANLFLRVETRAATMGDSESTHSRQKDAKREGGC